MDYGESVQKVLLRKIRKAEQDLAQLKLDYCRFVFGLTHRARVQAALHIWFCLLMWSPWQQQKRAGSHAQGWLEFPQSHRIRQRRPSLELIGLWSRAAKIDENALDGEFDRCSGFVSSKEA